MADALSVRYPSTSKRIIAIVGGFGSGKTEISVNLAKYLAATEKSIVSIIDLDLVNPYFRSREVVDELEALGIKMIAPRGGQSYADLPILLPEVKGALEQRDGRLILDIGGDAQGTKAFGSLTDTIDISDYEMLMVLNSRRPQTDNPDGCIKIMERIELSARLKFTGLIANSHMIDETDEAVVIEGYNLARKVGEATGLPLVFLSAKSDVLSGMDTSLLECPILPMTRSMLKPWEEKK